jgi:hypothetical protein
MAQTPTTFLLTGGLDLVTPRIAAKAGTAFAGVNFEPAERGYRRTGGYERFDGRLKPSEATYHYATFTSGSAAITLGTAITGGTSGATALAGAAATVTSGTTGGGNAAGYLPLVAVNGTFQNGEPLLVSAVDVATLTTAVQDGAPDDTSDATYKQAEATRRRGLIAKPVGSGLASGVWTYRGSVYAFRNNVGGTATDMWKASAAGWTQVVFGERIAFTTGTAEILEADTLTKGGVTSTVMRVVLLSGTWSGGTAAGYMVISGRAGGNYTAGAATSTSGAATLSGAQTAIALPPDGRYEFVNYRFEGAAERMYFVNGQGPASEFDGTTLVPINVPGIAAADNKPHHIAQFAEHLFLAYRSGSVLHSSLGNPREFLAIEDAGEHNVGSTINDVINANTSLLMLARQSIGYLTGSDNDTFVFQKVTETAGSLAATAVMMAKATYIDDRGIRSLDTTSAFGDWLMGSVSERIAPLFDSKRKAGRYPTVAIPVKAKNQYRVFYSDGTGVVCYLGRKDPEHMPFELPIVAKTAISGEDSLGVEVLFVAATDGYIYQLDVGPSFDGASVLAWIRLHFFSPAGTHAEYQWPWAEVELDGTSANTIYVTAEFDYGGEEAVGATESNFTVAGGGEFWDIGTWDAFLWDAPVQGVGRSDIDGYGSNCGLAFLSDSIWEDPYTLSSVRLFTSQRRQRR